MHHPTAALEAEVTTLKLRITTLEYELAKCRKDATYEHSKAGFEEWGEAEEGALMLTMERRGAA